MAGPNTNTIRRFLKYKTPNTAPSTVASPGLPIVEFHTGAPPHMNAIELPYGRGLDVTPFVTRIEMVQSTKAPWETITLSMKIPPDAWRHVFPGRRAPNVFNRFPQTGFWVVVRQPKTVANHPFPAIQWGYCSGINYGVTVDQRSGLPDSIPVTVQTESWWKLVNRQRIILVQGASEQRTLGSVYTWESWVNTYQSIMQEVSARPWESLTYYDGTERRKNRRVGYPGLLFQTLWNGQGLWDDTREPHREGQGLSWLQLPTSLVAMTGTLYQRPQDVQTTGGVITGDAQLNTIQENPDELSRWQSNPNKVSGDLETGSVLLKDEIPLVWNRYTAWRYAPARLPQQYIVPGEAINAWQSATPSGTLGQWLTETFQPDSQLVELFPSLEFPMTLQCDPPLRFPIEDSQAVDPTTKRPFDSQASTEDISWQAPKGEASSLSSAAAISDVNLGQQLPTYWDATSTDTAFGFGMPDTATMSKEELQQFETQRKAYLDILKKEMAGAKSKIDISLLDAAFPAPSDPEDQESDLNPGARRNVQFLTLEKLWSEEKDMTGLGAALGSQPVLMYRLRPKISVPLVYRFGAKVQRNSIVADEKGTEAYYKTAPRLVVPEVVAQITGLPTSFGSDSVYPFYSDFLGKDYEKGLPGSLGIIPQTDIRGFSITKSEDDRVNGTWVRPSSLPNSQMHAFGYIGDPYIAEHDHRLHGLRLYETDWPFFQVTGMEIEEAEDANEQKKMLSGGLQARVTALCDMFYTLIGSHSAGWGVLYGRAEIDADYRPGLQPGSVLIAELPETPTTRYGQEEGRSSSGFLTGNKRSGVPQSVEEGSSGGISGYCETVRHVLEIDTDDGSFRGSTRVSLSQASDAAFAHHLINFPIRGVKEYPLYFRLEGDKWIWLGIEDGRFTDLSWDSDRYTFTTEKGTELDAAIIKDHLPKD